MRAASHGLAFNDVVRLRTDTPGVARTTHFNNAGASLSPAGVVTAMKDCLDLEASVGGYEAAEKCATALQKPYDTLAKLINCSPTEIAVVQSATVAWQQVFFGLPFKQGDRILTSTTEYGSNYIAFLQVSKRTGALVEVVPEDGAGDICLEALEKLCTTGRKPALIAVNHVPTSSGRTYNVAGVGQVARKYNIPYLLDACQSVGQMPIDVAAIGCDYLCGTGRKYLRGPRGSGFLYAAKHAMACHEPAYLDISGAVWSDSYSYTMQPTARRYESFEMSMAAKVGLGLAVEYYLSVGVDSAWERIQHLAQQLREALREVPGVVVQDYGRQLCGIVSFTKDGVSCDSVRAQLAQQHINVSVSRITSSRIDFQQRGLQDVVRASVHYFNTQEEIDRLVKAVQEAC